MGFLSCFLFAFCSRFKESRGPNLSLDSCGEEGAGGEIADEEEWEEACDVVSGPGGNGSADQPRSYHWPGWKTESHLSPLTFIYSTAKSYKSVFLKLSYIYSFLLIPVLVPYQYPQ